ncbi:MAG: hypothetical protein HQM10_05660 [Candidatus Riflebacteria bacterium]|nr:hypothetical protein [Candidatus Riflebacteria bacterium]
MNKELLAKISQKIPLTDHSISKSTELILLICCGIPTLATIFFLHQNKTATPVLIVFGVSMLLIFFFIRYFLKELVIPMMIHYGFYPVIEYNPADDQIIINDICGFKGYIKTNARLVLYIKSIKKLIISGKNDYFILSLETVKGEIIPINSSGTSELKKLELLGKRLSSLLSVPLSVI